MALIFYDDLKRATGYERMGDIENCLKKNGVRMFYGKNNQIFTTSDALNLALGIDSKNPVNDSAYGDIDFI